MKRVFYLLPLLCLLAAPAWAFPDNGVLETFTGADNTTPPNSNWTNAELRDGGNGGGIEIRTNATGPGATGGTWGAYWDTTSFNADSEAFVTYGPLINHTNTSVYCRIANPGDTTTDAYEVRALDGTSVVQISRIDNGIATQLGTNITQTITADDRFGIKCQGTTISSWFSDDGGAWTQLDSQTDATYSAGGFIGMSLSGTTDNAMSDDFGGGNIAATTTGYLRRRLQ